MYTQRGRKITSANVNRGGKLKGKQKKGNAKENGKKMKIRENKFTQKIIFKRGKSSGQKRCKSIRN